MLRFNTLAVHPRFRQGFKRRRLCREKESDIIYPAINDCKLVSKETVSLGNERAKVCIVTEVVYFSFIFSPRGSGKKPEGQWPQGAVLFVSCYLFNSEGWHVYGKT